MKNLIVSLSLLITFCFISSFKIITENTFSIGSKEWPLTSSIIANESYGVKSKFELDLLSDSKDLDKAKTFIWLSISSSGTTHLTDGVYQYSLSDLNKRLPFQFNGSCKINGLNIDIVGGAFSVEKKEENLNIHFILKLANGDVAKGVYSGKAYFTDRSKNYN